jgi:NAD+ kinase
VKIAIHSRAFEKVKMPFFKIIFEELKKNNVQILLSPIFGKQIADEDKERLGIDDIKIFSNLTSLKDIDYMLSVGGDGTLLEAVTYTKDSGVPILGINLGRLGFLATISPDEIKESLAKLFDSNYRIERRSLIQLDTDKKIFKDVNFGLNEFTILKRDTSSMIVVHTYINDEYLTSYWADGLIISTPTGSTGYCLSVGGPVVTPESSNFVIAPVSPHNLNMRPLVVSDNSKLSFRIEGRSKNFLISLDSRSKVVDANIHLTIKKCPFYAHLIRLQGDNFLDTLKKKLNWGLDVRN